ncbi:MAG TPA: ATP-binding protein, partial [Polyangia bacterium]
AADAAAALVDEVDRRSGAVLGTTAEWGAIRAGWRELTARPPAAADALDLAHERLIGRAVDHLLRQVANNSNLILDPDLDSYWLMHAYVMKLPALAATVSRATAASGGHAAPRGGGFHRASELASDCRLELAAIAELEEVDLATAFRETARFGRRAALRARLEPPLGAAAQAVRRHAEALRREALGPSGAGGDLAAAATEALGRLDALQAAIAPELEGLIAARVARHQARRTQGLVAAATVAAILTYLLIGIYLSVRRSVSALDAPAAGPGAALGPPSRDEIGRIAVAYTRARSEKTRLEEQLRLAERLATIGTLAAGTAHELNEPLGAVLGFAQLAAKTPDLPEPAARDLGKITRAALHARDVIKKLLLFARQTPPLTAPIMLREVVQEALDLLQPRFAQAGVSLVRELGEVPPVLADAGQLRQVVLNLLVNALQATADGNEVRITLAAADGRATLVVADDGCGMSPAVQEQVFNPFFTTKEVGQGTGLGLAVVHGIVTSHHGTIRVESAPGHGSTFRVELPLLGA